MESCRLARPPLAAASLVLLVFHPQTDNCIPVWRQPWSRAQRCHQFIRFYKCNAEPYWNQRGGIFKDSNGRSLQARDNPPSEWSDMKHETKSGAINRQQKESKTKSQKQNPQNCLVWTITVTFNVQAYAKAIVALILIYSFITSLSGMNMQRSNVVDRK